MVSVDACPVCGCCSIFGFLARSQVPVHQNLLFDDELTAIEITRGDLDFAVCETCGFVFNTRFDLSKLSYGARYDNNQSYSRSFREYLSRLVRYLVLEKEVQNCCIVEIGCGNGSFLRALVAYEGANNIGYGFDPSYRGPTIDLEGRVRFEQRYYGEGSANEIAADVVVCRHVIEHIPQPLEFMRAIRKAIANSTRPRIFLETPCVEWILRNQVVWDFFYEHCSLFSPDSITTLFELSDFQVNFIQRKFGRQYLWVEASPARTEDRGALGRNRVLELAQRFKDSEPRLKDDWLRKVENLRSEGRVAVWGAGAKGATLVSLIDPRPNLIDCVVDVNPNKQGKFISGTGHPIIDPRGMGCRGIKSAILMNPNYREENLALINEIKLSIHLVA